HTRFSRDWSSDVCSSDLIHYRVATGQCMRAAVGELLFDGGIGIDDGAPPLGADAVVVVGVAAEAFRTPDGAVAGAMHPTRQPRQIGRASCRERAQVQVAT